MTLTGELMRLDGAEAVRHLFTVTAGLDSQILGETEILGQVRRAFDAARAAGTTTREMDAIFSAALAAGRRVRHETLLGRHPSSVSSAAVELAAGAVDRTGSATGRWSCSAPGKRRRASCARCISSGATRVALVNRHPERAAVLATAWGATPHGWEALPALLDGAELLFVATAASRPVVSAAELAAAVAGRTDGELLTMDLSVPRNVQPEARSLPGVRLFDLDDLQRLCCPAAGTPAAALDDAERVLDEELARLDQRLRGQRGGAAARGAPPAGCAGGGAGGGLGAGPARGAVGARSGSWSRRWRTGWCGGCCIR